MPDAQGAFEMTQGGDDEKASGSSADVFIGRASQDAEDRRRPRHASCRVDSY
jgi:hypothetical protein